MEYRIDIERMAYGPEAVGHLPNGKAVFVPGAAPGDTVEVRIVEDKKNYARAELCEIVEPSPHRVAAQCAYADVCGGCPWQHLDYNAQLEAKRAHVVNALVRTAHLDADLVEELVAPCDSSKRQWGYRNKIELQCSRDEQGQFQLGFAKAGSHEVFTPEICPVAVKPIQKAPKALRGALRFAQGAEDLGIFRVGVRGSLRTKDVEVALWTPPGAFPRAHIANTVKSAVKNTSVVRVIADPGKARKVKNVECLSGKGCWEETLGDARFLTSAPSFFQVNTAQAEKLVDYALEFLGEDELEGACVADLYAGGGTFSMALALAGADVVAVEAAGSSVRDLRRNADLNEVWVDVSGGDTGRELPGLGELDMLIVDPPRAGLADGVVESIVQAGPEKVVYVSCDPQTLARDILRFQKLGYELARVQPVDLFPQTYHVETVALMIAQGA